MIADYSSDDWGRVGFEAKGGTWAAPAYDKGVMLRLGYSAGPSVAYQRNQEAAGNNTFIGTYLGAAAFGHEPDRVITLGANTSESASGGISAFGVDNEGRARLGRGLLGFYRYGGTEATSDYRFWHYNHDGSAPVLTGFQDGGLFTDRSASGDQFAADGGAGHGDVVYVDVNDRLQKAAQYGGMPCGVRGIGTREIIYVGPATVSKKAGVAIGSDDEVFVSTTAGAVDNVAVNDVTQNVVGTAIKTAAAGDATVEVMLNIHTRYVPS